MIEYLPVASKSMAGSRDSSNGKTELTMKVQEHMTRRNGEDASLGWNTNYFYMMNLRHHQDIGQKYPAWNWKKSETAEMFLQS